MNGALLCARSLSHSELAPLRVPLVPMEHCTSRFFQECDADKDKQVSIKEWTSCFGIKSGESKSMFLYFLNCTQDSNSNDPQEASAILCCHFHSEACVFLCRGHGRQPVILSSSFVPHLGSGGGSSSKKPLSALYMWHKAKTSASVIQIV